MAAAVCPGAPFLIADPSTNPARLGARVPGLAAACRAAVAALAPAERLLVVGGPPGRSPAAPSTGRLLRPGSSLVGSGFRRGDLGLVEAITPGARRGPAPPVLALPGTVVGLDLLAAAGLGAPTWAWEVDPAGPRIDLDPARDAHRWGLLVSADGAARHGDDAPGRRDARSAAFDTAVAAALGAGDPRALAEALDDPALPADDLLAGCAALRLLAGWTGDNPPARAATLFAGAPFGVGYLVAWWSWVAAGR